jgi:hypothetical protein
MLRERVASADLSFAHDVSAAALPQHRFLVYSFSYPYPYDAPCGPYCRWGIFYLFVRLAEMKASMSSGR